MKKDFKKRLNNANNFRKAESMKEKMSRRSKYDIIVDILKSAINGERKTKIMTATRLSYAQLKFYLDLLYREGFLENSSGLYKTTLKGYEFLKNFEAINIFSA